MHIGEALSLFSALIDFPAPNLIFIQIFTYLHGASECRDREKNLAGEKHLIVMLSDLSNKAQRKAAQRVWDVRTKGASNAKDRTIWLKEK